MSMITCKSAISNGCRCGDLGIGYSGHAKSSTIRNCVARDNGNADRTNPKHVSINLPRKLYIAYNIGAKLYLNSLRYLAQ